jgi:hypothetical protein
LSGIVSVELRLFVLTLVAVPRSRYEIRVSDWASPTRPDPVLAVPETPDLGIVTAAILHQSPMSLANHPQHYRHRPDHLHSEFSRPDVVPDLGSRV